LLILLWLSVGRGLFPLGVLTRQLAARAPDTLAPLEVAQAPAEVRPMVSALNDLMGRMAQTLERERRFTADAAHELRTPLAAIKALLYVARMAEGVQDRRTAMDQLQRGVERAIRLVGQMLALARLDPQQALPDALAVDLATVAQAVCAELAPLALSRKQTLEMQVAPPLPPLLGNADMLFMLLSNLIDNAIRYTQEGGQIRVELQNQDNGLQIKIIDNGPGIAVAQRERVFDRFFRIAGQNQPGTGLGLTICKRIAELHQASIRVTDGAGGLGTCFCIHLRGA
ncbi:MAG: ATP-binding protein, partial [Rhodoferax sp.]